MLSLPPRIRYGLAWDHARCRVVVGAFMRAVLGFLRRRARVQQARTGEAGRSRSSSASHPTAHNPRSGDPGGAALNVNVHVHALVVDGVYAEDSSGGLRFHPATPPTDAEMDELLGTIERRIGRVLAQRGVVDGSEHGPDRWAAEAPVLAGMAAASVQGRVALGPRAGAEVRRCGKSSDLLSLSSSVLGPCHARQNGFDLHAGVVVPERDRARLERVCRLCGDPHKRHNADPGVMRTSGVIPPL